MYLTVREVLAIPPVTELTLVAGEAGLDRKVTRVSVLEIVRGPGTWWRGGEFFMSALAALSDDTGEAYAEIVRTLETHNAAALALHPGTTGHRHLDMTKAAADRSGLPLLLMPPDMPYTVITEAVMGGLLGRQAALLERSAAINRELIQIVLRGGDLAAVCRAVARRTGRSVVVVGSDGQELLASSGPYGPFGYLLPQLLANRATCAVEAPSASSFAALSVGGPGRVLVNDIMTCEGPYTQIAAPIVIQDAVYAYLVTWGKEGALSELDSTVLAHACTAVGLEVLQRRAVLAAERRVQQDFYGAALSGEIGSVVEAEHRGRLAGVELAPAYVVATLAWGDQLPPAATEELSRWPGCAFVVQGGSLVVIVPVCSVTEYTLDEVSHLLEQTAGRIGSGGQRIAVGISNVADGLLHLPEALAEARLALTTAEHLNTTDHAVRYDHLGVFQLLADVPKAGMLLAYAERALAPLLRAHDGVMLADTLEVYFDAGGSPRGAALALHLHTNTIKYRLRKIRQILGDWRLDDPESRLGLHVALKLRHLHTERCP